MPQRGASAAVDYAGAACSGSTAASAQRRPPPDKTTTSGRTQQPAQHDGGNDLRNMSNGTGASCHVGWGRMISGTELEAGCSRADKSARWTKLCHPFFNACAEGWGGDPDFCADRRSVACSLPYAGFVDFSHEAASMAGDKLHVLTRDRRRGSKMRAGVVFRIAALLAQLHSMGTVSAVWDASISSPSWSRSIVAMMPPGSTCRDRRANVVVGEIRRWWIARE